ncbi:cupin domain-containing [Paramyrothecium foliicola]|nr:cupin domain-containing [Paramyrothecium foliicola]
MASLLPIISDIIPMIIPSTTHVTRSRDLEPSHPTVEGPVIRRPAIVGKCDKMCASVLTTRPHSVTPGLAPLAQTLLVTSNLPAREDAIVYVASGTGLLVVNEGFNSDLRLHELSVGDFAVIPAWTEHQIRNDTDADVVCVIIQSGPRPEGATLTDWGGDEVAEN